MSLTKTEHLGLNVFLRGEENEILVRDLLRAVAEDGNESNMQIIDGAIYELQKSKTSNVVWSNAEPENQVTGDIWNEIVTE